MTRMQNDRRLCRRVLQGPPTEHSTPFWRALKDAPTNEPPARSSIRRIRVAMQCERAGINPAPTTAGRLWCRGAIYGALTRARARLRFRARKDARCKIQDARPPTPPGYGGGRVGLVSWILYPGGWLGEKPGRVSARRRRARFSALSIW